MEYTSLEQIKNEMRRPEIKTVSFDVFDTLLVRPTADEEGKFRLLDRLFFEKTGATAGFWKIRSMAEADLRRNVINGISDKEDFSADEIYEQLVRVYRIDENTAAALKAAEFETEQKLCRVRKSGRELYDAARESGRQIIILSDMYWKEEEIRILLEENGFKGADRIFVSSECGVRKLSGGLYRFAAEELGRKPEEILHIGDDPESDGKMAESCGMHTALLPKTDAVFARYGCAHQVEKICRDLTDLQKAEREPGIRIMRKMAANLYFDDPFRPFASGSDYNADPYFAGYAALGPEVFALVRWLADNLKRDGAEGILFLSRDGYLPMKIYEEIRKTEKDLPPAEYIYASRLSLLPAMIRRPVDLFNLPADLSYQTPRKLFRILSFCAADDAAKRYENEEMSLCPMDDPFTKSSFAGFCSLFIREYYDAEKHARAKKRIRDYLLNGINMPLTDRTAVFDMGYSGRMAEAICEASGETPFFYFMHGDGYRQFASERYAGIRIRTFFDFDPYMEAAVREYAYLEPAASCIGYSTDLEPVFDEGPAPGYCDAAEKLQQGACDFARDFLETFAGLEKETAFRYHNAAMPFEAFLRFCSPADRKMFSSVLLDDELWGGRRDISLDRLIDARRSKMPSFSRTLEEKLQGSIYAEAWLGWYEFREGSSLLLIREKNSAHTDLFCRRCAEVTVIAEDDAEAEKIRKRHEECDNLYLVTAAEELRVSHYDYVVSFDDLEYSEDPADMVKCWMSYLKPHGRLLLGTDNRYGLKYFCGAKEKHTGIPYAGVNGYFKGTKVSLLPVVKNTGRSFSKKELTGILADAGTKDFRFFYPVPDARMPQMIYTDHWRDGSDAAARLCDYHYEDDSVMALEHRLFPEAVEAGVLPEVSDSFLIEISADGALSDINYAVITAERGPERAMTTAIHADGRVVKRPLYPQGIQALERTFETQTALKKKGVPVIPCVLTKDDTGEYLEMPFSNGELLTRVLKRCAANDKDRFFALFDRLRQDIRKASAGADNMACPDLVPGNAFYEEAEDKIIYFDQEFAAGGHSPDFVLYRAVKYFFTSPERIGWLVQKEDLCERYGFAAERIREYEKEERELIGLIRDPQEDAWVVEYSVPDPNRMLQRACAGEYIEDAADCCKAESAGGRKEKPYRKGYVPGVFDLFHTGHLRLIERCKERCEYLIVGVLTDELVEYYKGRRPVMCFEDRKRIIEALRDADEVIAVDFENTDKIRAWEQLHYDCHFSGDDHTGDWDHIREELKKRGAEMEFFSYTKGISTTEIIQEIRGQV